MIPSFRRRLRTMGKLRRKSKSELDVEPKDRYNSSYSDIFVNQRDVQQRTAAEMVGVIPTNEKYKKVWYNCVSCCNFHLFI